MGSKAGHGESISKVNLAIAATLVAVAVAIALVEIGVRLVTRANPDTGVLLIGRFALMPYRPEPGPAQAALDRAGSSTYVTRDEELGWAIRPNGEAALLYTATAHGFRGPKNWAPTSSIPQGKTRISVYGDSFTHGDGVELKHTWAAQMQQIRPDLEVLNFGVPAYGTDQAFLRFRRDGRKFAAQYHVLGIWPEDLVRNLNVVRFYLSPNGGLGGSKPRFTLSDGRLSLINSPILTNQALMDTVLQRTVSSVVRHDYWYREDEQSFPAYYHMRSVRAALSVLNAYQRREARNRLYFDREGEALKIAVEIADAFRTEVETLGSRAIVTIIPMRDFLDAHASGGFPLVDMLKARSITVLDFGPAFASTAREAGIDTLYLADGHLTALGNKLVAQEMVNALR